MKEENKQVDYSKLNIYQKIQKIKKEISEKKLKKTGENKYSGFKYYELNDFVPALIELCDKYQIFTKFELEQDEATLTILNCENTKEVVDYSMPTADLELKGANKIQSIGGVQTYLRRYLYMIAFDIVESDTFDRGNAEIELTIEEEKDPQKIEENKKLIIKYKKLLFETDTLEEKVNETFKVKSSTKMTQKKLKKAIAILERKPIVRKRNEEINEGDIF